MMSCRYRYFFDDIVKVAGRTWIRLRMNGVEEERHMISGQLRADNDDDEVEFKDFASWEFS